MKRKEIIILPPLSAAITWIIAGDRRMAFMKEKKAQQKLDNVTAADGG
jgi:hypothetical protein